MEDLTLMTNTEISTNLNDYEKSIEEVEEYCHEHGERKVLFLGKGPYCPVCSAEKVQSGFEGEISQMTNNHYNNAVDWLALKSIYLDKTLKYANFESYIADDKETTRNKEKALEIARSYYKGATYNSILQGRAGAGKSHLAMSILKNVNKYSKPPRKCLFISIDELMRKIKGSFNDKESIYTEANMVSLLAEADLLVIDDLGAETGSIHSDKVATDYTTQVLYAIMNSRMDKATIYTTNLDGDALIRKYDDKIISRMHKGSEGHIITFNKTADKRTKL